MQRRTLRWTLLLLGIPVAIAVLAVAWERRPNPILVTVLPGTVAEGGDPAPVALVLPAGGPFLEVEVARVRAIPMRVVDLPVRGKPGLPVGSLPDADPQAVMTEEAELRDALQRWLAEPGRRLKVVQIWPCIETTSGLFTSSRRTRVILRARLAPSGG